MLALLLAGFQPAVASLAAAADFVAKKSGINISFGTYYWR
jgi:hypothetical protein